MKGYGRIYSSAVVKPSGAEYIPLKRFSLSGRIPLAIVLALLASLLPATAEASQDFATITTAVSTTGAAHTRAIREWSTPSGTTHIIAQTSFRATASSANQQDGVAAADWQPVGDDGKMTTDDKVGITIKDSNTALINYTWVTVNSVGGYCTAAAKLETRIYSGNELQWSGTNQFTWGVPSAIASAQDVYTYQPPAAERISVTRGGSSRVEVTVTGVTSYVNSSGCEMPDNYYGTVTFTTYVQ